MGPASIHLGGLHNGLGMGSATGGIHPSNEECGIREVWAHNMEEEFKTICQVGIECFFCKRHIFLVYTKKLYFGDERFER